MNLCSCRFMWRVKKDAVIFLCISISIFFKVFFSSASIHWSFYSLLLPVCLFIFIECTSQLINLHFIHKYNLLLHTFWRLRTHIISKVFMIDKILLNFWGILINLDAKFIAYIPYRKFEKSVENNEILFGNSFLY